MDYDLLIDLGISSTHAALVDISGSILSMRSFLNRYYRDEAYPDAQFFLPQEWQSEILRLCLDLHAEHPDIRVRCVSAAARQSIVLLDAAGKPFYGLPNIDNRGREFMGDIGPQDLIYRCSGKWVTEDFPAAKLLGLRKRRPELYSRIHTVLSLSGFIAWIFTGIACFEPSQACETQLLPDLAEDLGMRADACFVAGGADTQCGLLQTGIMPGDIAIVSGTTTPVTALTDHKFYDEQRVWVDANLGAKGYLIEMNPGVTGLNYQRIKDVLAPDISYEALEREYRRKQNFLATASFSSLLFYERRSLRHGGFFLPSPWPDSMTRVDLLWAALADIACSTYEQLQRLIDLSGHQRDYVFGCGGGLRSGTLCQMIADLSGLELRLLPGFEQATLYGLTVLCNHACHVDTPAAEGSVLRYPPRGGDLIRRYHERWREERLSLNPPVSNN